MALINCPECGKEISDKAKKCIYCGCPQKRTKKALVITIFLLIIVVVIAVLILPFCSKNSLNKNISSTIVLTPTDIPVISDEDIYLTALAYYEAEDYQSAKAEFSKIPDYPDVHQFLENVEIKIIYTEAKEKIDSGNIEEGLSILESIKEDENAKELIKKTKYDYAIQQLDEGKYQEAYKLLIDVVTYEDSYSLTNVAKYESQILHCISDITTILKNANSFSLTEVQIFSDNFYQKSADPTDVEYKDCIYFVIVGSGQNSLGGNTPLYFLYAHPESSATYKRLVALQSLDYGRMSSSEKEEFVLLGRYYEPVSVLGVKATKKSIDINYTRLKKLIENFEYLNVEPIH